MRLGVIVEEERDFGNKTIAWNENSTLLQKTCAIGLNGTQCGEHGDCVLGECLCHKNWTGYSCNVYMAHDCGITQNIINYLKGKGTLVTSSDLITKRNEYIDAKKEYDGYDQSIINELKRLKDNVETAYNAYSTAVINNQSASVIETKRIEYENSDSAFQTYNTDLFEDDGYIKVGDKFLLYLCSLY